MPGGSWIYFASTLTWLTEFKCLSYDDKADDVEDGANYYDDKGSNSRYPELVNLIFFGNNFMQIISIKKE